MPVGQRNPYFWRVGVPPRVRDAAGGWGVTVDAAKTLREVVPAIPIRPGALRVSPTIIETQQETPEAPATAPKRPVIKSPFLQECVVFDRL